MTRSSVVLPQPEGPRRVKSSPSSMARLTALTAASEPNRLVSRSIAMRTLRFARGLSLELFGDRLDVLAILGVHLLVALLRQVVVVDIGHFDVEVRAHAAGELDRHLGMRSGLAFDAILGRDRED